MPQEDHLDEHRHAAQVQTARLELDRAHRAALAIEAGEVRRGLELAAAALRAASETQASYGVQAQRVEAALADLDEGKLAEMENLIEQVRKEIEA